MASALHPSIRRCDEVLEGVEWAVAHHAEQQAEVPGTLIRVIRTRPFPDIPPLRIYFRIDDETTCTLLVIEVIESPDNG
jgi:hypothetical protein